MRTADTQRLATATASAPAKTAWEYVHTEPTESVRRMAVPGGWLYQTELCTLAETPHETGRRVTHGWHPPVFVPSRR